MAARSTPEALSAAAVRTRLDALLAERDAALHTVLARNDVYMDDLDADIEACRAAYVGAVVTEIALRRSAVHGPLRG